MPAVGVAAAAGIKCLILRSFLLRYGLDGA
jgi:hypothetical protein